jgi:DNA (cytosine-5)-methyltransferase 1
MTKFKEWPDANVDVLVGGTPCQSFSVAGLRKGLDDPRGNLMLTYLAIAAKYRPRWLVWENVPGVLSSNGGNDFASLLRGLGELGYGFAYRILDAQYFGVPQRRRRVFVVGCAGGWQRAAAVLFERHSLQRHIAPRREAGQRVAKTVTASLETGGADYDTKELIGGIDYENNGHGPTGPTGPLLKGSPTGGGRPLPAIVQAHRQVAFGEYVNDDTASAMKMRDYKEATDLVTHSLRGEGFDASEDGTGCGTPLVPVAYSILGNAIGRQDHNGPNGHCISEEVAPTLDKTAVHAVATTFRAKASFDLGVGIDVSGTLEAVNPTAVVAAFKGNQGSAAGSIGYSEHVAPTLSSSTPTLMQTMQVRRLTPRECERLQGFPDDYTLVPHNGKIAADGPRYKALGNSMAVPVMAWIGKRIQQVEEITCTTKQKYLSA